VNIRTTQLTSDSQWRDFNYDLANLEEVQLEALRQLGKAQLVTHNDCLNDIRMPARIVHEFGMANSKLYKDAEHKRIWGW